MDYEAILREAEREADVVIWDGGNNDTPFFKPGALCMLCALRVCMSKPALASCLGTQRQGSAGVGGFKHLLFAAAQCAAAPYACHLHYPSP